MLKSGILDVQGKTVENSLHSIGFESMTNVRIGKYVQLEI
jgi:phosphoribosylformylglycinamidine synthase